jgi:hypothetical protein
MGAWRRQFAVWLGLVVLAGRPCAGAAEPDPAKLAQVRSLVAEAVMLNRAEATGRVTRTYRRSLREDLADDLKKLESDPALGGAAREASGALERRDTARLLALRDRLVALERSHGRAD